MSDAAERIKGERSALDFENMEVSKCRFDGGILVKGWRGEGRK